MNIHRCLLFLQYATMAVITSDDVTSRTRITIKNRADQIEWKHDGKRWIVEIRSPSGIGKAELALKHGDWPNPAFLRLHLKGLESFRMKHGSDSLHVAISSDQQKQVRIWKNDREQEPLTTMDTRYVQVQFENVSPTDASEQASFVESILIAIPKAFLTSEKESLTLEWIDFYRH